MPNTDSPDPSLALLVVPVMVSGAETSIDEAVQRQLASLAAPAGFALRDQPEGWRYAEVSTSGDHVVAACAVRYASDAPTAVLAVTYLMNDGVAVAEPLFARAGGRAMLCGVAASARRLDLVRRRR